MYHVTASCKRPIVGRDLIRGSAFFFNILGSVFIFPFCATVLHCSKDAATGDFPLLSRLCYGFRRNVFTWFRSYLMSRKRYVQIEEWKSSLRSLVTMVCLKVPYWGLYLMYTSPIVKIIKHHGLQFYLYADDFQLHISKSKVEGCVRDIDFSIVHNGLKLWQDKSEFGVFSSKFCTRPALDCV